MYKTGVSVIAIGLLYFFFLFFLFQGICFLARGLYTSLDCILEGFQPQHGLVLHRASASLVPGNRLYSGGQNCRLSCIWDLRLRQEVYEG